MKPRIILRHKWALGDTVLLSALVRDIHLTYPDEYEVAVDTNYTNLWDHNPRVVPADPSRPAQLVEVGWGKAIRNPRVVIDGVKQMRHILAYYHHDFTTKTGMHVPVHYPKGELFLPPSAETPLVEGRYWLMMAGGKMDITNKLWPSSKYQAVVDALKERGILCVQGGATHSTHIHTPLQNCLNLVGKSNDIYDLFNLVRYADGVICPVTAAMHIAAVYDKPCVVIGGAREEPWFYTYTDAFAAFGPGCDAVKMPHKALQTLNQLPCCLEDRACWRRKTVISSPAEVRNVKKLGDYCVDPVAVQGSSYAHCMNLITPQDAVKAVMEYYEAQLVPPVGAPRAVPESNCTPTVLQPNTGAGRGPAVTVQGFDPASLRVTRDPRQPVRPQVPVQQAPPAEVIPGGDHTVMDHPLVGGKYTVCVCCYGPHFNLQLRCIESILATLPRARMDLCIGCNDPTVELRRYLEHVQPDAVYVHLDNVYKDAVMREMFYDPRRPLQTSHLVWFDDDTQVVDPRWADILAETIVANHPHGCRLYGDKRFHDLNIYVKPGHRPDQWFRQATWWNGVPLRLRNSDRAAPNGSCIDFAVGYFWAIHVPTILQAQIPDARLVQGGDDIVIGEQVHQCGGKIKSFNVGKKLVWCPSREEGGRREFSATATAFPWAAPAG